MKIEHSIQVSGVRFQAGSCVFTPDTRNLTPVKDPARCGETPRSVQKRELSLE